MQSSLVSNTINTSASAHLLSAASSIILLEDFAI